MELALSLLGETEVSLNGKLIEDLCPEKAQALLFYLVVESSRAHRREFLAEMFWPEKPPGFGRNSLKQALSQLKKALGDKESETPYLISSKRDLQFNTGSSHQVDVLQFEELTAQVRKHCGSDQSHCDKCLQLLNDSEDLYRDDFLADFYLSDSPEFNEWVLAKREAYKRIMAENLAGMIKCYEEKADYKLASEYAEKLVSLEPWSESSHRKLMALLAACGKRSAALMQFHDCAAMLASEFNVKPAPETKALFEKIKEWKTTEGVNEILIIPSIDSAAIPAIEDLSTKRIPSLRFWVIGSAVISLLVLIGFIVMVWKDREDPGISPAEEKSPTQVITDNEEIQSTAHLAPEVETYLGGENPNLALAAFYNQTRGSNWTQNQGWMVESNPCEWFGITCQDDTIIEIRLPDNNLEGILPPELGDILSLKVLDLSKNALKGSIPPEFGNLTGLEFLYLEGNFEISGKIPPEIGNLHSLEVLILSSAGEGGSLLSGTLPVELGELIKIDRLIIEDTLIHGSIPPQLGNLLTLSELSLSQNNLSGSIPDELFSLAKLRSLDLWSNQTLSGELSPKIGQLKKLDFLNLSHNNFSGPIPDEVGTLPHLNWIGLSDNQFEGTLPGSLTLLDPISFNFAKTNLCVPDDPEFQAWLDSINNMSSTGKICDEISSEEHNPAYSSSENDPYTISSDQACLPGEQSIYLEDFQDGQAQGWPEIEYRAQNWDIVPSPVEPGNLVVQNPGVQSTAALYQGEFFQNTVFRLSFMSKGSTQPTILWHSNNEPYQEERGLVTNSDYSIGFMYHGTHFIRYTYPLPEVALQEGDFWITNETWHQLEISTYKGMLRVWLDGEELLAYQDPNPLPTGTIGIGLGESLEEGSMVYFDNLSVCELSEPFESIITQ